ncbi:MAG: DUF58 domain-containing protein [Gammaproteobacteria bacterium]|nr:DUF58 domain-containing protein [Gammaproteobacteria bacterium]
MAQTIVLERALSPAAGAGPAPVRRRVYIFFSRQGLMFLITLVVMLLGAVNYTNSMAYLLTFLLTSLLLVCMLHTYRNLRGLVVKLAAPEAVFAGGTARFPLLFDNRAGYDRPGLNVRPYPRQRWWRADGAPAHGFDVRAGEMRNIDVEISAKRRGLLRLDRLLLSTRYPLGLLQSWSYLDAGPTCLVYPRPAGSAPLPPVEGAESAQLTGRHAGADDFTGFRAYRPGDSIRNIDWKALAREQGLLVKRFEGAGAHRLVLRWDAVTPGFGVEAQLSQLCRWVLEAEKLGYQYALELPGIRVDHGRGADHQHQCLEQLARYGL